MGRRLSLTTDYVECCFLFLNGFPSLLVSTTYIYCLVRTRSRASPRIDRYYFLPNLLRSSASGRSLGARKNGPSDALERGVLSELRGEKLFDDRGVCPVPFALK